jgi:hypothetical protein
VLPGEPRAGLTIRRRRASRAPAPALIEGMSEPAAARIVSPEASPCETASRVRPELRFRVPDHVVHRQFPTQTVVLNLKTGLYHGLNSTAGAMLCELHPANTIAAAARLVSERYSIPRADVERDLCELCRQLLDRGLIEPADASSS